MIDRKGVIHMRREMEMNWEEKEVGNCNQDILCDKKKLFLIKEEKE